ncbi:MAG TPA: hypothetical protein VHX60_12585 [Acidobacteriaceae bacterium]|nr:hypothetical protein [Acidobacteriaceae bacterium]
MPAECAFTLPTGKKCRCMATREHKFCRHHGAPRQKPHPSLLRDHWSRLACWRDFGRSLNDAPPEEIPHEIIQILSSLLIAQISDRTAGRFLRILLQRCGDVPLVPISDAAIEPPAREVLAPSARDSRQSQPGVAQLDIKAIEEAFAMIAQLTQAAIPAAAGCATGIDHPVVANPRTPARQVTTDGRLPIAINRIR